MKMRKFSKLAVMIILLVVAFSASAVSEKTSPQVQVELRQVSLFKNGLGFFVCEVTCPDKESFIFEPDCVPSHGTFWVSYPPEVKLEQLTAKEVDIQKSVEAADITQILKANEGKKVGLYLSDSNKPAIEGVIEYFTKQSQTAQPEPYSFGRYDGRNDQYVKSLMMIKTVSSQVAIDPTSVRRVDFFESKAEKIFYDKIKSTRLEIKLSKAAPGKKVMVSYLSKGITWAPSYTVDITKSDKALVSAKAEVINEVCDLDDVTVQLVTGFPNLLFADIISPVTMKENLAQFLWSLERPREQRESGITAQAMYQRAAPYGRAEAELPAPVIPSYGSAQAGKAAEDLFAYPVEKVFLAKRQVAYLPLFTESVPYEHIYRWEIPDYINEDERYYGGRERPKPEPEQEVWHCLKMTNATKVPWTTAPAEIVSNNLILGQDIINYTAPQDKTVLRITRAISIKAEQAELETARKRDALQLYGDHFDLVTIEGKLLVTNFQPKAATVEITKTLSGEVKSSQPQAKIESVAKGLSRMNGIKKLTWTIELKPSEQKQLGYIYDVYVRR
jgi:hypothetical protein